MTGVEVTERHTQDGYDWPNGVQDERWPAGDHRALARHHERFDAQMDAVLRPPPDHHPV